MTLSYSVGLTTGSAVAYLLDEWLGPHDQPPCEIRNMTGFLTFGHHLLYNGTRMGHSLPFPASDISV